MHKVRLNLDALAVESFQTDTARATRGTVQGNQEEDAGVFAVTQIGTLCQTYRCVRTEWYSCAVEFSLPASCQGGCDCTQAGSPC